MSLGIYFQKITADEATTTTLEGITEIGWQMCDEGLDKLARAK